MSEVGGDQLNNSHGCVFNSWDVVFAYTDMFVIGVEVCHIHHSKR